MELEITTAVDPSKAPRASPHGLKVPVLSNPIRVAPAPKGVPTLRIAGASPKTKPFYGMTLPILTAPSQVDRSLVG